MPRSGRRRRCPRHLRYRSRFGRQCHLRHHVAAVSADASDIVVTRVGWCDTGSIFTIIVEAVGTNVPDIVIPVVSSSFSGNLFTVTITITAVADPFPDIVVVTPFGLDDLSLSWPWAPKLSTSLRPVLASASPLPLETPPSRPWERKDFRSSPSWPFLATSVLLSLLPSPPPSRPSSATSRKYSLPLSASPTVALSLPSLSQPWASKSPISSSPWSALVTVAPSPLSS